MKTRDLQSLVAWLILVIAEAGALCYGDDLVNLGSLEQDVAALEAIKAQITEDPTGALITWGGSPYPCQWTGVECDLVMLGGQKRERRLRVVSVVLWDLDLAGRLAPEVGHLTELRRLTVVGTRISGQIPSEISACRELVELDLRANQLSGGIPFSLSSFPRLESLLLSENFLGGTLKPLFELQGGAQLCPELKILDVGKNRLEGSIPGEIGKCRQLQEAGMSQNGLDGPIHPLLGFFRGIKYLLLNSNLLVGPLPSSIAGCSELDLLDVSDNRLTGVIPEEFASFSANKRFNFSINDFRGPIPEGTWGVQRMALAGVFSSNPRLCGSPIRKPCENLELKGKGSFINDEGILQIVGARVFSSRDSNRRSMAEIGVPPESPQPAKKSNNNRARKWALGLLLGIISGAVAGAVLATCLRLFVFYFQKEPYLQGPIIFSPKIHPKMLAFLEKEDALPEAKQIGAGGAGKVYKVVLESPNGDIEVAVKAVVVKEDPKVDFGGRQIQSELETIGCIKHRNLTALLAYIHKPSCHLLLYQYMKNGSLADVLKKIQTGELVMPWPLRHKMAVGIADGLAYLHFDCDPKIVHRDLKPSNILLDEHYVAHLADFGLAKIIQPYDTHVTATALAGTVGYIAPEYGQTWRFTFKSDVYAFGVVLAVLLTGRDPTDQFFHGVPGGTIGSWLARLLQEDKGSEAIDPTLRDPEHERDIIFGMKIAVFCTSAVPAERPSSKEALAMLRQIRLPEPDVISSEEPSAPLRGLQGEFLH